MCSRDDEIETLDATSLESRHNLIFKKCNKCRTSSPNVVLRNKDAYCKPCFLAGTVHKFKAFLGKHRLVNLNDSVLVYLKGGHPSTALLHLLRSGLELNTPKRLCFKPVIIYIMRNEQEHTFLQKIYNAVNDFNFTLYFILLKDYVCNSQDLNSILHKDFTKIEPGSLSNYQELPFRRCNPTAKQTLESIYERRLLIDVAKHLQCKCIFIPDNAVDVATNLLANTALGRGIHLALDIGICDTRDPQVTIARPLRHFEMKELAFYNFYNNLEPIVTFPIKENPKISVQSLMKTFVANLQVNFPATVTTVLRTGEKLSIDKEIFKNEMCMLCRAPKETNQLELTSAEATNFSHYISTRVGDFDFTKDATYEKFQNQQSTYCCHACTKIAEYVDQSAVK